MLPILRSIGVALASNGRERQAPAWQRIPLATEAVPTSYLLVLLLSLPLSLFAQPYGEADRGEPGDEMIQTYLAHQANEIHEQFLVGVHSKEEWLSKRPKYKEEFFHMLGLWPVPEKTPLEATVTGTLERDGYTVEMLHYQSRPGLYVTGNLYRPSNYQEGGKLPAILYVCGHGPQGRNGNKTTYQSHGIWYAKHGYICIIVDTLQMGEIAAIHHGTYREERWWWHSRGYTSAGVECWNGIRGIDYLVSRPDVDPDRIGVTGRSGGGAATFWIAAADERVKAASAVSGMADLPSYVNNRVINGHCDCMFMYNTFEWPWVRIAGLLAPRPLLFVNGDVDPIFPMDANQRLINRMETLYSLFGASDQVDAVVSQGGHSSREDIRKATYRFMNIHLKNDPAEVMDSEFDLVTGTRGQQSFPIQPELLRVFPTDADIPEDELNTTIDRHFVPLANLEVPEQGNFDVWKSQLIKQLRQITFQTFPDRIPPARMIEPSQDGATKLETEDGISVSLALAQQAENADRIVLHVNHGQSEHSMIDGYLPDSAIIYRLDSRGTKGTRWTQKNPPNYVERSHVLLGRTVDAGRIWDIIATAKFLKDKHGDDLPLIVSGERSGAVLAAYAALLEKDIDWTILIEPMASHMEEDCPPLLNVLRICDIPQVIGALAPKRVYLAHVKSDLAESVLSSFQASGAQNKLVLYEIQ